MPLYNLIQYWRCQAHNCIFFIMLKCHEFLNSHKRMVRSHVRAQHFLKNSILEDVFRNVDACVLPSPMDKVNLCLSSDPFHCSLEKKMDREKWLDTASISFLYYLILDKNRCVWTVLVPNMYTWETVISTVYILKLSWG